ncbi:ejaculatory bulb-specific protein 3-like [Phymastichus coffea]|uniref:ejaculatory bulb-specific protein 3-like n=1 Tax=Phymastichus coffea TaxID=108790 RepID=UPI00273B1EFE|nr:ejaculatory bulb-specific protein 3-like [Phymastichus coffea]
MKRARALLLGCLGCFLAAVLGQEGAKRLYTTKYDNLDVEAVINNQRLLKSYVGCLLERNACTADAAEMRRNLPDALATNCGGCSEAQKRFSDRMSHHLIDRRPEDWAMLEKKYDPTGDYRRRYLKQQQQQRNSEGEATETTIASSAQDEQNMI